MIIFFIAGFIAGVVSTLMLGRHIVNKAERSKND